MSWWLSVHVRRIIAVLLLVLDLGLEPGSGLSFVGIAGPDEGDAVADLCRQDDFWWGRTCAGIDATARAGQDAIASEDGSGNGLAKAVASVESSVDQPALIVPGLQAFPGAAIVSLETGASGFGLRPFDKRSPHRNSYIAQKRDIVLIV